MEAVDLNWRRYKSHKIVEAIEITGIGLDDGVSVGLLLKDHPAPYLVSAQWMERKNPHRVPVGYLVRYEDGYQSWSPKEAFDSGYTELPSS